ncbi:BgTH12-02090 [Blumeria graminis f. sp. triticale]|uniref:Ribosome quality control complex subunit 2 n=1 Tax=Blumeria graminis f. sp. triticale TaxID=1689686 RepID=A0A9W4D0E0_BLUGR|nr:BgTH12-02090 [Blumeria graminis f. sp. triticale]
MKQRLTSLDVKVIAHELSTALVTLRLQNIYDLSTKIFLVKFAKPGSKQQIVIENGFRCHLTKYARTTAATPSIFVQGLRKRLKTRRVTSVSQIGSDRIIEIQFSDGQYRIFLEFFAAGNIILTDNDLKIISLIRPVPESKGQEELRVGLQYSMENRQNYKETPTLDKQRVYDALVDSTKKENIENLRGKKPKKELSSLRNALAFSITEIPPILIEHCMEVSEFDSKIAPSDVIQSETLLDHLTGSLKQAQLIINEATSENVVKGYIVAKKKPGFDQADEATASQFLIYDSFHPFRPAQHEKDPELTFLEIKGFNNTVDEFFSSLEGQKLEAKLEEREQVARQKIESARNEQAKRLHGLQEIQSLNERKAAAIQANIERVQEVQAAVNGLIAQGTDWVEIGKLIELDQRQGNPIAMMVSLPLKLDQNTITLKLCETKLNEDNESAYETDSTASESDEDLQSKMSREDLANKRILIDIDLGISPWANAREYFGERRTAIHKEERTIKSSKIALKSQEAKIKETLQKGLKKEKEVLRPIRQALWFEKFFWFISSDGYLVLAARDKLQSETLYKKYLKKGDVYVHADLPGAAITIIKNRAKISNCPIPPSTLSQAGTLAVACSSAWESKSSMSAWWANAEQICKTAPTGDILPVGIFHVCGAKSFLPASVMALGFGALFRISDESLSKRLKRRNQDDTPDTSLVERVAQSDVTVVDLLPDKDDYQSDVNRNEAEAEVGKEGNDMDHEDNENESSDLNEPVTTSLLQSKSTNEQEESGSRESFQQMPTLNVIDCHLQKQLEPPIESHVNTSNTKVDMAPSVTAKAEGQVPPKNISSKRGKKSKAKKIMTKYKFQEEEDRIAAQQLIGSTLGQEKANIKAVAKAAREAELEFHAARKKAQHLKSQKEAVEFEELRKHMLEGEYEEDDVEENTMNLENLVGMPNRGDEIVDMIPVCAPLTALRNYKYRVKLHPGAMKKGKAIKDILGKWLLDGEKKGMLDENSEDSEKIWPREMELLRGWKPVDISGVVPVSKVRVVTSGESGKASKSGGPKAKAKGGKKG